MTPFKTALTRSLPGVSAALLLLVAGRLSAEPGPASAMHERRLREAGGSARSEKAVLDGLRWLALHQAEDGHWGLHDFNKHARTAPLPGGKVIGDTCTPLTRRNNDTAGTAFGLLPFLAAGITHKKPPRGSAIDYSATVDAGLKYLLAKQSSAGADRGSFGGDLESHALATIAVCEAYGMTADPKLKAAAQLAVSYIVAAQHEGGGWRYSPRQAGELSITGWNLMALLSAQMAGLSASRQALKKVERFLDSCETEPRGGYRSTPSSAETPSMTAVGALCRQYLGTNPRTPSLLASISRIKKVPPGSGTGGIYYEYYATQVMHHMGGEAWQLWNLGPDDSGKGGIRDTLIARQDTGARVKAQAGSWAGNEQVGGRLGATSLSLLALEVYYRHLPLHRRDSSRVKD